MEEGEKGNREALRGWDLRYEAARSRELDGGMEAGAGWPCAGLAGLAEAARRSTLLPNHHPACPASKYHRS